MLKPELGRKPGLGEEEPVTAMCVWACIWFSSPLSMQEQGEDKIEVGVKVPSWCRDTASSPETLDLPISMVVDGESPLG